MRARRWRNEPSNGPWRRSAAKRRPRAGQAAASGQAVQRGTRAMQTVAPRSISASAASGPKLPPVRSSTRRTFTSAGSTGSPKAKRRIAAAVYGPTPGSEVRSAGQPDSATRRAVRWSASARRL